MIYSILTLFGVVFLSCGNELNEKFDLTEIGPFEPQQIHLALGKDPSEIIVTWSTWKDTEDSFVTYSLPGQKNTVEPGTSKLFLDYGLLNRAQYIHRATLSNLKPNTTYTYHCGSRLGISEEFWFRTFPSGTDWSPNLLFFGDLGLINPQSLPTLIKEVQSRKYDAVLHVGDFAYNFDWSNGTVGDKFMNIIQPIAAYIPYMTCPGNHEAHNNFHHYRNRFNMPGASRGMYYSWNMGPIHFIALNTEAYYFNIVDIILQHEWLEDDLKEANKPENRAIRPWIITYGHRPMYCSDADDDDCTKHDSLVRIGIPVFHWFGLEKLFANYGVDLEIWAHEHTFERLWPVFNHKVYNGSSEKPYTNPSAPVHVVSGSAGCQEKTDFFPDKVPVWSAFRSSDYGFSHLKVYNKTHLYVDQYSDDQSKIIDSFWYIKEKHEAFLYP